MGVVKRGQPELTNRGSISCKMKVFAVLLLASYAVAHGGDSHNQMFKSWSKTKALESCWGEDNMKIYTVNIKKAIAKCNQVDAPELDLPPYRSVDRFVNTMLSFAQDMESNQFEQLYRMMSVINDQHYDRRNHYNRGKYHSRPYMRDYDSYKYNKYDYEGMDDKMSKFRMMMNFRKMMNAMKQDESFMSEKMMPFDMMKSKYSGMYGMDNKMDMNKFEKMFEMVSDMKSDKHEYEYEAPVKAMRSSLNSPDFEKMASLMMHFRSKRQANDALALNDRLKEKIEHVFEQQQARVGNMTCVLREMNCLNADNEIDVRAMKKDSEQYSMPSVWFKRRYEEILDTCYEVATNLPADLDKQNIVTGDFGTVNMGRVKSFMGCCKEAKQKLCMSQDIKNKIEANFGPVDEILESFKYQITEDQLFTQVQQLLQGAEEEYM